MTFYDTAKNVSRPAFSSLIALSLMTIILLSIGPLSHAVGAEEVKTHQAEDIIFLEMNTQLPDGNSKGVAQPASTTVVLSAEEIAFLEMNTQLPGMDEGIAHPAGAADVLSSEEIKFLEENLMLPEGGYPDAQPASAHQWLSSEEIRFLEENSWEQETLAWPAHSNYLFPQETERGKPY